MDVVVQRRDVKSMMWCGVTLCASYSCIQIYANWQHAIDILTGSESTLYKELNGPLTLAEQVEPSVQREIEATHNINASVEARLSSTPQQDTLQSAAGRFTIGELGPHRMHFCAQTMRMFLRSILFGRGRDARKDNVPVCLRPSDTPAQMLAHNRKKSLPPLPPGARHQGDRVPSPEQSRSNVDRHGRQRTHAV